MRGCVILHETAKQTAMLQKVSDTVKKTVILQKDSDTVKKDSDTAKRQ